MASDDEESHSSRAGGSRPNVHPQMEWSMPVVPFRRG